MNWNLYTEKIYKKVVVKPMSALITKTDDLDISSNIYCKIAVDEQECKTSYATNNGKAMVWADVLEFTIECEDAQIHATLHGKDSWLEDESMGEAWIPIFDGQPGAQTYSLFKNGNEIGKITITIQFV